MHCLCPLCLDDKQVEETNTNLVSLIENMERKLEMITKWLKNSGLVVNEEKTELCLFYKTEQPTVELSINGKIIRSKKSINVLGIVFDSQMKWNEQVAQAITKSKRALQ